MAAFFIFVIWVALTVVACNYANNRGRSPIKWLIFCIFLSPIIALIAIYCSRDLRAEKEKSDRENIEYFDKVRIGTNDFIEHINSICSLRDHEMINETEFIQQKRDLITELSRRGIKDSPEIFLSALIPLKEKSNLSQEDIDLIKNTIYYQRKVGI